MKKMISVLLTVCMVLSLFAVAAVSVGAEEDSWFAGDYTVTAVGNGDFTSGNPWLNGAAWIPSYHANLMTEVREDVWEITYHDVPAGEDYMFKFAINGNWTHNFGGNSESEVTITPSVENEKARFNGGNIEFSTSETSDITLRLDLSGYDNETKLGAKFSVSCEGYYYLVGVNDDWNRQDQYRLRQNPANPAEYMLQNVFVEKSSGVKVLSADNFWYPGIGDNYSLDAGYYDIYFKPNGGGGESWYYDCIYAKALAVLKGYSTTVKDSVALNFYTYLPDDNLPTSATLTWGEDDRAKEVTVNRNNFSETQDYEANYKFTADVAAVSMNDEVTLTLYYADNSTKEFTGSVVKYCNLLAAQNGTTEDQKKALDNMLDYGAAVQEYFNYKTDALANANNGYQLQDPIIFAGDNADSTYYEDLKNNPAFGVKFKGAILSTTSKLALRLYFDVTNKDGLEVIADGLVNDGMDTTLVKDSSRGPNAYYVEIDEIASCNLFDDACFVLFTRGEEVHFMTYDVRRYAKRAIEGTDAGFANVMTRLYYYSTTIGAAFGINAQ